MQQVLHVMETSVPTRLIFLDACRNNPLAPSFQSGLGANWSAVVGPGLGRLYEAGVSIEQDDVKAAALHQKA